MKINECFKDICLKKINKAIYCMHISNLFTKYFCHSPICEETVKENKIITNEQLENENEGKLLAKYALPSIISLIITSVYNIVDQIFIGRGVGYIGNTATNISYPLVTFSMGVILLFAHGGSVFINLKTGEGNRKAASQGASAALWCCAGVIAAISALSLLFMRQILMLFGATEQSYGYAFAYAFIIMLGMPFHGVSVVLSNYIRADGNPRFSMAALSAGAVLNCFLDPLFIFVFRWGVAGGAAATVLGQLLSLGMALSYVKKFRNFSIKRDFCEMKNAPMGKIMSYGTSTFAMRMCLVVVQVLLNNTLRTYGALSMYGSEIAMAAAGVTQKLNMLAQSCMQGIATGQQPILGYNYAAKRYKRVKRTFLYAMAASVGLSFVFWGLIMLFPRQIMELFGKDNGLYTEFAVICLTTKFKFIFTMGFTIITSYFYQGIGMPKQSVALTILRQFALRVPLLLILPKYYGIMGALYAYPVCDVLCCIVGCVFMIKGINLLKKKEIEENDRIISQNQSEPANG